MNKFTHLLTKLAPLLFALIFLSISLSTPVRAQNPAPGHNDINICSRLGTDSDPLRQQCQLCLCGPDMNCDTRPDNGIWTAVGCVSRTNVTSLTTSAITLAISIAGGISLLLILYGAFFVSTSQGDPQKLQQGKETVTSAIAGLVFIILSVSLLSFIGTDLLQLPGF